MLYLIEDNTCIYSDEIICDRHTCDDCDLYVKKVSKQNFQQISIFDYIKGLRGEYANRNDK